MCECRPDIKVLEIRKTGKQIEIYKKENDIAKDDNNIAALYHTIAEFFKTQKDISLGTEMLDKMYTIHPAYKLLVPHSDASDGHL